MCHRRGFLEVKIQEAKEVLCYIFKELVFDWFIMIVTNVLSSV